MNAHTRIRKESKRGLADRMRTRAYRRGLGDGFAAHVLFYDTCSYPRAAAMDVSVEGAWKAVANALSRASEKEVKRIGKAAREVLSSD